MAQTTKTALAVVAISACAIAFWLLALSPKRDKAGELGEQVASAKASLSTEKQRAAEGAAAKKQFPHDYQQLILLGKAVPAEAETAALMVQLNALGRSTNTPFLDIASKGKVEGSGVTTSTGAPVETTVAGEPPLGSEEGPAGFRVVPAELTYAGGYFALVEFMRNLNGMVTTESGRVSADGHLVTIDSFSLKPVDNLLNFNRIAGFLSVSSYTAPPGQGLTAGATPSGPT